MKKKVIFAILAIFLAIEATAQDNDALNYHSQVDVGLGVTRDTSFNKIKGTFDLSWHFVRGPIFGKLTVQTPIGRVQSKYKQYAIIAVGGGQVRKHYSWGAGFAAVNTKSFDSVSKHNFYYGGSIYLALYNDNKYESLLSVTYAKRRRTVNDDVIRSLLQGEINGRMYMSNKYMLGVNGRVEWNQTTDPKSLGTYRQTNDIAGCFGISAGIQMPILSKGDEIGTVTFTIGPEFNLGKYTYQDQQVPNPKFKNYDSPTLIRAGAIFNFLNYNKREKRK